MDMMSVEDTETLNLISPTQQPCELISWVLNLISNPHI